jgi:uncharacterized membrane protein YhaH (DUF805 family)
MDVWKWYVRQGRVSRQEWWLQYFLPGLLVALLARWADQALGLPVTSTVTGSGTVTGFPAGPLERLVDGLLLVPTVSALVARLHDQGDSAWRLLLVLVPVAGLILLIVLVFFMRGGRLPNRYGPAPAPMRWSSVRRARGRSARPPAALHSKAHSR